MYHEYSTLHTREAKSIPNKTLAEYTSCAFEDLPNKRPLVLNIARC